MDWMKNKVSSAFDTQANKNYSEFNEIGPGHWNAGIFKKEWKDIYKGEESIKHLFTDQIIKHLGNKKNLRIVDFGGGDGCLLDVLRTQLKGRFELDLISL